ncbi:hypothetical protein [Micromonospora sp. NPDC000668]|uniref:hypothetical protein n=1 Tax=Micromonospora sp. NPDC000668 TaxID=3364219 RepID=UPI00368D16AC
MNDAWRDVESGRQQLDWAFAIGDPGEAEYLTPLGHQVASRAITDLDAFFGPGWLHRATHPGPGTTGPTVAPYFASLLGAPAFVAAIGLWARLQVLVDARVQGIGQVRKNLRVNPAADEFRHHIALARLAVLASQAGARLTLEPVKPQGGPGDLRAVRAGSDVFVEVRALGPGQGFRAHSRWIDDAMMHLRVLEVRHDVHWDGELPTEPDLQWKLPQPSMIFAAKGGIGPRRHPRPSLGASRSDLPEFLWNLAALGRAVAKARHATNLTLDGLAERRGISRGCWLRSSRAASTAQPACCTASRMPSACHWAT